MVTWQLWFLSIESLFPHVSHHLFSVILFIPRLVSSSRGSREGSRVAYSVKYVFNPQPPPSLQMDSLKNLGRLPVEFASILTESRWLTYFSAKRGADSASACVEHTVGVNPDLSKPSSGSGGAARDRFRGGALVSGHVWGGSREEGWGGEGTDSFGRSLRSVWN